MRFVHLACVALLPVLPACSCQPTPTPKPPPQTGAAGAAGSPAATGGSAGTGASACVPEEAAWLDVDLIGQDSDMLCWAAVTQMVGVWAGKPITQCDQVKANSASCTCQSCPQSASLPYGPCNQGDWPHFTQAGLHAERTHDTALTLDQLKQELGCNKRPVAFTWHTGPNTGHIMVAYGYDGEFIEVLDPWAPCEGMTRQISYDEYVSGNVSGTSHHWDDFYGIRSEVPR